MYDVNSEGKCGLGIRGHGRKERREREGKTGYKKRKDGLKGKQNKGRREKKERKRRKENLTRQNGKEWLMGIKRIKGNMNRVKQE